MVLQGNHADPQNMQIFNTNIGWCIVFRNSGVWIMDGFSFSRDCTGRVVDDSCLLALPGMSLTINAVAIDPACLSHVDQWLCFRSFHRAGDDIRRACALSSRHRWQCCLPKLSMGAEYSNAQHHRPNHILGFHCLLYWNICRFRRMPTSRMRQIHRRKYVAVGNGIIDSAGRGVSYLPGTIRVCWRTGGQYL